MRDSLDRVDPVRLRFAEAGKLRRYRVEVNHCRKECVGMPVLLGESPYVVSDRGVISPSAPMYSTLLSGVGDQDGVLKVRAVQSQMLLERRIGECLLGLPFGE